MVNNNEWVHCCDVWFSRIGSGELVTRVGKKKLILWNSSVSWSFFSVSGSPCHATLPPYPASFQKPWVCWVNRSRTLVVDLTHTLGLMFFCCVLFSTTFATQSFQMNCAYTILYKGGYLQRAVCVTWACMSEHCEILFPCVLVCTYSVWPTSRVNFCFPFHFYLFIFPSIQKIQVTAAKLRVHSNVDLLKCVPANDFVHTVVCAALYSTCIGVHFRRRKELWQPAFFPSSIFSPFFSCLRCILLAISNDLHYKHYILLWSYTSKPAPAVQMLHQFFVCIWSHCFFIS